MDKNLKKVATYRIDECTPIRDAKIAREHLKDCKPFIVDDAVSAFESVTCREMLAVEYIHVECGCTLNTVSCCGYVWRDIRTASRWWFCYCENAYTGDRNMTVLDDNDEKYEYII